MLVNDMVLVDSAADNVYIHRLTTSGPTNMIARSPNTSLVEQADNVDGDVDLLEVEGDTAYLSGCWKSLCHSFCL